MKKVSGKSFQDEPECGPWASCIFNDKDFAARYVKQDLERYLGIVADTCDALFPSSDVSGPPAEDLMNLEIPCLVWSGDDPSHATSAAHQLRELLPCVEYWDVNVANQTHQGQLEQILKFKANVEAGKIVRKAA